MKIYTAEGSETVYLEDGAALYKRQAAAEWIKMHSYGWTPIEGVLVTALESLYQEFILFKNDEVAP